MNSDELAVGQGNPPEVVTGTVWLVNVADELALLQVPLSVAAPEVALQLAPKTLAVHTTPPAGAVRLAAPPEDADNVQVPLVLQVVEKVKPLEVTVHPVRVGAEIVPVIGCPEGEFSASPDDDDPVQVTVADVVPPFFSTMVTLGDDVVKGPVGVTESATAMWAPRPSAAASTGVTR